MSEAPVGEAEHRVELRCRVAQPAASDVEMAAVSSHQPRNAVPPPAPAALGVESDQPPAPQTALEHGSGRDALAWLAAARSALVEWAAQPAAPAAAAATLLHATILDMGGDRKLDSALSLCTLLLFCSIKPLRWRPTLLHAMFLDMAAIAVLCSASAVSLLMSLPFI